MPVRVSAKAIVIHDEQLLAIRKRDSDGIYYILPGGGQEVGETLIDAVKRECMEEANLNVLVGPILLIRDYIGKHHEHAAFDRDVHQLEIMFACTPADPQQHLAPASGSVPDDGQEGVEWLPLATIEGYRIYPQAMRPHLRDMRFQMPAKIVCLGDVN